MFSKPLMYAYALQEIGKDKVHKYVGQEPSGHRFNELVLDHKSKSSIGSFDYLSSTNYIFQQNVHTIPLLMRDL